MPGNHKRTRKARAKRQAERKHSFEKNQTSRKSSANDECSLNETHGAVGGANSEGGKSASQGPRESSDGLPPGVAHDTCCSSRESGKYHKLNMGGALTTDIQRSDKKSCSMLSDIEISMFSATNDTKSDLHNESLSTEDCSDYNSKSSDEFTFCDVQDAPLRHGDTLNSDRISSDMKPDTPINDERNKSKSNQGTSVDPPSYDRGKELQPDTEDRRPTRVNTLSGSVNPHASDTISHVQYISDDVHQGGEDSLIESVRDIDGAAMNCGNSTIGHCYHGLDDSVCVVPEQRDRKSAEREEGYNRCDCLDSKLSVPITYNDGNRFTEDVGGIQQSVFGRVNTTHCPGKPNEPIGELHSNQILQFIMESPTGCEQMPEISNEDIRSHVEKVLPGSLNTIPYHCAMKHDESQATTETTETSSVNGAVLATPTSVNSSNDLDNEDIVSVSERRTMISAEPDTEPCRIGDMELLFIPSRGESVDTYIDSLFEPCFNSSDSDDSENLGKHNSDDFDNSDVLETALGDSPADSLLGRGDDSPVSKSSSPVFLETNIDTVLGNPSTDGTACSFATSASPPCISTDISRTNIPDDIDVSAVDTDRYHLEQHYKHVEITEIEEYDSTEYTPIRNLPDVVSSSSSGNAPDGTTTIMSLSSPSSYEILKPVDVYWRNCLLYLSHVYSLITLMEALYNSMCVSFKSGTWNEDHVVTSRVILQCKGSRLTGAEIQFVAKEAKLMERWQGNVPEICDVVLNHMNTCR